MAADRNPVATSYLNHVFEAREGARGALGNHGGDGGGVTIDGPSLLVSKKFAEKYSVAANYYVDMISSASIDVVNTASPYEEQRDQVSLTFDMLNDKTQYSLGVAGSDENDYTARTASFDVSQDLFGDLTTVSLGFSRGWDEVGKRGDADFDEPVDRRSYRLGLSQIVTPALMMGFAFQPEVYPSTRTSSAVSLNASYFLRYRAAVHGEYRFFTGTWGIDANTVRVGYNQPVGARWILEGGYRWYGQSNADFYSDLFPRRDAQNFLGRDKELSTFTSQMLSFGATYELLPLGWGFLQRSTVNVFYDRIRYDYDDFRNVLAGGTPGTEPLYGFDADVLRVFVSAWL